MKCFSFTTIFMVALISIHLAETEDVVVSVYPTEPLHSCPGNSSCPPGQFCHTMDYLVQHSYSEFFSREHANVTLVFMCGVHNYTKDLTVQNLNSFTMKAEAAESKENVMIDHQFGVQLGKPNCTTIQFLNVSFVNITNMTMICPSINVKGSLITVKSCNVYGYKGIKKSLSFFNIMGRGSRCLLDSCIFKENCPIMSNFSNGMIVNNSTFQSYNTSIIVAYSSEVTLAGNVNFTNSLTGFHSTLYPSGTAVFLSTTHPEQNSSLHIITGATVYFVNLTSNRHGGAVYGENGTVNINTKAKVIFMNNRARFSGGAMFMYYGIVNVKTDAELNFINNSVTIGGGAILLQMATIIVETNAVNFYDNRGQSGGAIFIVYGTLFIKSSGSVVFIMNTALQGGAVYIYSGSHSSIIVDDSAKIFFSNNSALQGGALYVIPSSFAVKVGYQSSVQFINNTATDVGGAVYSEMASTVPCIFLVTDYSAELSFIGNHAKLHIGHHIYGTGIRLDKCDRNDVRMAYENGKPYCWYQDQTSDGYIKFSFNPGLNETLSPISSAPWRVCLCDSNGEPLCANLSQIFLNISVYHGETFTLSACVVGYDFGTTLGSIHARFLTSNHSPQLEKSQYIQSVDDSICSTLEYTIYSNHDGELLQLHTSILPPNLDSIGIDNEKAVSKYKAWINNDIGDYISHANKGCLREELLTTPLFINVKLFPECPPGLTFNHDYTKCGCYSVLADYGFRCLIQN